MNIVTKSGTNDLHGSFFELFRDDVDERADRDREAQRTSTSRTTAATSSAAASAARSCRDKAHFFAAFERTQQDTFQVVNTQGLFPSSTASTPTPYRENLFTGKVTANLTPAQYLSVRYGRNNNSQPYGAAPQPRAERLGRQREQVQLDQRQPQLGARRRRS